MCYYSFFGSESFLSLSETAQCICIQDIQEYFGWPASHSDCDNSTSQSAWLSVPGRESESRKCHSSHSGHALLKA